MKKFGKLSRAQFARAFKFHPRLEKVFESMKSHLAAAPEVVEWSRKNGGFSWAWFYELKMEQAAAVWFIVSDQEEVLASAANAEDPQEEFLNWAEAYEPDDKSADIDDVMVVVASLFSIFYSWAAIGWYSRSMFDLMEQTRNGDDDAFMYAISVDPSCLSGPTGLIRVSRAVFESDTSFLKKLSKQYRGPDRSRYTYSQHRVAEFILRDSGAFRIRGNREEIFDSISQDLGLSMKRDGDPFKAWMSRVANWQREARGKSTK